MTRRLLRPVPPLADCALTYHAPKSRVRWQVWSPPEQQWVWIYGTVLVHRPNHRLITVALDDGREVTGACAVVVSA